VSELILVAGLGSILMGDDGVGPHVIQVLLDRYEFPEHVHVRDLGTPGLALASFITGYSRIIFVDTVHDAGSPGTIRRYNKEHLLSHPLQKRVSPHDPALNEALLIVEMAGEGCKDAVLIGMIPERIEQRTDLSAVAEKGVEALASCVLEELRALGVTVNPRAGGETGASERELIFKHL
jgi:hydrogenase maturation protease